jgi:protein-S-isoprenylcysteine O-methyltransferase Ste14
MSPSLPLIAATIVAAVGGGLRIRYHRRRYGSSAVAPFEASRWRDFVPELAIGMLALTLVGEMLAWAVWPRALAAWALTPPLVRTGVLMIGVGLLVVLRAQIDMGASWRIGIDRSTRPGLVTHGLYRLSRNPIYSGAFIVVIGFVFLMPTALSILILCALVLSARAHVVREERYLTETYGPEFQQYAARVGRFVPGTGLLS